MTAGPPGLVTSTGHAGSDLRDLLDRVVHATARTVPGVAEASITLVAGGRAHTAAATGALARELDERQYRRGHGPCLEATEERTTVVAPDLTTDIRWYGWTAPAVAAGVGATLSIGLSAGGHVLGALNLYGRAPGSLDAGSDLAHLVAATVTTMLTRADA